MLSCGPPIAQIRGDPEEESPCAPGRYTPWVLLAAPRPYRRAPGWSPRTPGWLEGLRAPRLPHRSGDWQRTKGLLARRVPFPTPQRLQSQSVWAAPQAPKHGVDRNLPCTPNRADPQRGQPQSYLLRLECRAVCPAAFAASGPQQAASGSLSERDDKDTIPSPPTPRCGRVAERGAVLPGV